MAVIIRIYTQLKNMVIKDVPLQLLSVRRISGDSKNGKGKFDFRVAQVLDENGALFEFFIDKQLEKQKDFDLDGLVNAPVLARLRFYVYKGGLLKCSIEDLTEKI